MWFNAINRKKVYTYLGCKVHPHAREGRQLDMLKFQLWEKVEATSRSSFSLVQVSKVAPIDTLAIDLIKEHLGNCYEITKMYIHVCN